MKTIPAAICGMFLATAAVAQQTTTVQTTTLNSAGTLTEIQPNVLVVKTEAAAPITYRYSKTTTYVDETGAPVSMEVVRSGLPVTVHYIREGSDLVASRVIVRKAMVVAPAPVVVPVTPTVVEKTTTTTTETKKKDKDD